jgi:hypothetical protein
VYTHLSFGAIQVPPQGQAGAHPPRGSGVVVVTAVAKNSSVIDKIEREVQTEQAHGGPAQMNFRQAHTPGTC